MRLDPMRETADINEKNNSWPIAEEPSTFQLFKNRSNSVRGGSGGNGNPMQKEIKP